ncbi:MAG: glycosyltransferase family 4 protein [Pseudomonadota bacterium]|uniref:Glycosyltransferase family 4 protein n=1 Tax=Candidatus Desulfatibia profunda TaxID=2841695 RepID=A0A8J6NPU7_9BACT|nr:glycosyltransferase family 4 protein [Candidatus Desulfatibia profunda]MBL7179421.1 glycosyltransferase family 4 protein [Desulfobacterales bacterium]MBU0698624.1 glycosyltransferase family 4 protein [Pseudomonadota bacterium]
MAKKIGFISTRFAGTDGVTMEASKWAEVLKQSGHTCFWFAGELDRNPHNSLLVPEAHFKHEKNQWINERIFGHKSRSTDVTDAIHDLKVHLKIQIKAFISQFNLNLLIAQNVLTIPLHIPLGIALTELIAETQVPTIAHHHDFYWERTRFSVNAVGDYLRMAFPPNLTNIEHVVINSAAQEELALRTGISSVIIPNVLDFENPPEVDEAQTMAFRNALGLEPQDHIILQPTRIVQRKGIEHAIELVEDLKDPQYKLVISHEAGDEGYEYSEWLQETAREREVDLRLVKTRVSDPLNIEMNQRGRPTLWDIYPHADFITYPSLYEGFGNAFLEAVYFKKPLLINRYATFVRDIEPKGFDLIVMDGFLTKKNVQAVREVLNSPEKRKKMVDHNYEVARRYYSYAVLRRSLNMILMNFFGMDI